MAVGKHIKWVERGNDWIGYINDEIDAVAQLDERGDGVYHCEIYPTAKGSLFRLNGSLEDAKMACQQKVDEIAIHITNLLPLKRAQEQRYTALIAAFQIIDAFAVPTLDPDSYNEFERIRDILTDTYSVKVATEQPPRK